MAQLRQDFDKFTTQETEIVVVGPEGADSFSDYWREHKLPFIGLPDPSHTVLKRYGQEVNLFKFGRMPAQVASIKMEQRATFTTGTTLPIFQPMKKFWIYWKQ